MIKLTAKEMFVVLFYVPDNSACDRDFCQQVEVPENEKLLAYLFILVPHIVLIDKDIVIVLCCGGLLDLPAISIHHLIVCAVLSVSHIDNLLL